MKQNITLNNNERTRVECYSRVMGYFRHIAAWNHGKKQEFQDRKMFDTPPLEKLNN